VKRFQNKVAESRLTLPVIAAYGIGMWLLCGFIQQNWWIQFICYMISTYLMIELNNSNALIRIYSRTVSAAFIILSCMACFLFPSMNGAIAQLCIVASLLTVFRTYQDKSSVGWCFYTFLFLSLGSLTIVQILWFVPVFVIVMAFFIYSLSYRTFCASLIGLLLPYWFLAAWTLWESGSDFTPFIAHFSPLTEFLFPFDYQSIPLTHILTFIFLVILCLTGIVHYLRTSYNDKIRIRQIFYSFIFMNIMATVFVAIQPQYADLMLRMMIITTSPIIAHFISLTYTRFTNIAFYVIMGTALILTVFNLWSSSLIF
jgi:hypothetical protein